MDKEKVKLVKNCRTCEYLVRDEALGYAVLVCGHNIEFSLDVRGEKCCEFHGMLDLEVHLFDYTRV